MAYFHKKQSGMVLLVSLLILLLMAIIATTVTQTNVIQLQMAGNDEAKTDAIQRALAMVDAVIDNASNTPVRGDVGYMMCAPSSTKTCDEKTVNISSSVIPSEGEFDYFVTRMGPEYISLGAQGRPDDDSANTGLKYVGAILEVSGTFDGTDEGLGAASVVQGVLVKLPISSQ
jgi:hypothetical protein